MNRRKSSRKSSRKSKKSIIRPSLVIQCNFVFDIIVTNFDTPQVKTDDKKKLTITVQFNGQAIEITEDRINVDDFVDGTATKFTINPYILRQNIEECGMPVSVKYNGEYLGSGQMFFPESVTENIDEDMSELIHSDTCQFKKNNEVVGTVEFQLRLLVNCNAEQKGPSECRQLMGCCIRPHDILFLISDTQNPCNSCIEAWEQEAGDERLNFDLLRYQSVKPPPTAAETMRYNPGLDAITSELKKMTAECIQTLDNILKGTNQLPPLNPSIFAQAQQQTYTPPPQDAPVPKKKGAVVNPNKGDRKAGGRSCPGCLGNMSWLPFLAACPNCGLKPTPLVGKAKKLRADQIVEEYLGEDHPIDYYCSLPVVKKKKEPEHICRCTCKYGKLCAFCRVRKKCEEFLNIEEIAQLSIVPEPTIEEPEEDILEYVDNMKIEEKSSRPFLARVFSEMRDLHEIKDTVQLDELEKEEQARIKACKLRRRQKKAKRQSLSK